MEAESYVLPKMWDSLCLRNMGVDSMEERDILICDAAADQCTVTRHAWHIDSPSSRCAACDHCLDKNNATKCQLASSCTTTEG